MRFACSTAYLVRSNLWLSVSISLCSSIVDAPPRTYRGLRGLNLSGDFKVKDLSPLQNLPTLTSVVAHDRMSGVLSVAPPVPFDFTASLPASSVVPGRPLGARAIRIARV